MKLTMTSELKKRIQFRIQNVTFSFIFKKYFLIFSQKLFLDISESMEVMLPAPPHLFLAPHQKFIIPKIRPCQNIQKENGVVSG